MDPRRYWTDADLLIALDRYKEELSSRALSPFTVRSYVYYGRLFLRWRTGDYVPCDMPLPTERPVPAGTRSLEELRRDLEQYAAFLSSTCLQPGAVRTYLREATQFVRWLGGEDTSGKTRHARAYTDAPPTTVVPSPRAAGMADEFARIRDTHPEAIVRTVARMAVPGSVGRVFKAGTTDALLDLLPRLPLDALRDLSDQSDYRTWFEAALEPVATTILRLNPPGLRGGVHPGYRWGHGTKVLSLFVRDLVLFSRFFTEEEARRIEWWLYCPIDRIVIDRLRQAGFDPKVSLIREIDEAAFWRIQDALAVEAARAGVPRVWFDDVWSEPRE